MATRVRKDLYYVYENYRSAHRSEKHQGEHRVDNKKHIYDITGHTAYDQCIQSDHRKETCSPSQTLYTYRREPMNTRREMASLDHGLYRILPVSKEPFTSKDHSMSSCGGMDSASGTLYHSLFMAHHYFVFLVV